MSGSSPARLYAALVGGALVIAGIIGFFYEAELRDRRRPRRGPTPSSASSTSTAGTTCCISRSACWASPRRATPRGATRSPSGSRTSLLAIWGFLETEDGFGAILDVVPVNTEDNFLHLILGLTGLAAGAATPKPAAPRPASAAARPQAPRAPASGAARR